MPISQREGARGGGRRAWRRPLDLTPVEAAWGILTVLATNVMMAMRTITIERGYDPREFTLVPFGGMGPTIAGRIIAELGIGRILIPRDPGTFSAFGMLVTDVHQTRSFTRITRLDAAKPAELETVFAEMEEAALADLLQEQFAREQLADAAQRRHALSRAVLRSQRSGRCAERRRRSRGARQALPRGAPAPLRPHGAIRGRRDRQLPGHRGRHDSEAAIQNDSRSPTAFATADTAGNAHRLLQFSRRDPKCRCFAAPRLRAGAVIDGPAVIEEKTSTTVLYPGQRAEIDGYLNIAVASAADA